MAAPTVALAVLLLIQQSIHHSPVVVRASPAGQNDNGISKEERAQLCAHFLGGLKEIPEQGSWQKLGLCTEPESMHWFDVAKRNCISCQTGRNVCKKPPKLLFHQYLDALHPTLWRANLLSAQSVLVRCCMRLRVTDVCVTQRSRKTSSTRASSCGSTNLKTSPATPM